MEVLMDFSSLVAAHLLDCNRPAVDLECIGRAVREAERRKAIWRHRLAAVAMLLRSSRRLPNSLTKLASASPAQ